ncbi:sensor histidine kinase [Nitrosopumilus sp.]|uniref:sensor histidine kinase n=1 Tax=Nitrosopumilus sp. TaxID=2024843 RepID=UPI003D0B69F9
MQKDEFVSIISHEIKNSLTPIMLACQLLLTDKDATINQKQKERIEDIMSNCDRLSELLSDLNDVKKLDMGTMKLKIQDIESNSLFEKICVNLKDMVESRGVVLDINVKKSKTISCDVSRISQVITNIVKNAVDFVPKENGKIIISSDVADDGQTLISIEDNGIGIPEKHHGTVFEKFHQLVVPPEIKHKGTGLGLAICKGIIESHGGKIWVAKDYTNGAKFNILLP